eukprot:COSAG01_NODE_10328_length_2192_cov_4.946011_4_plen_59_part_00
MQRTEFKSELEQVGVLHREQLEAAKAEQQQRAMDAMDAMEVSGRFHIVCGCAGWDLPR